MTSDLEKHFQQICALPTSAVIEGCVNNLRTSMKSLARLHIQEGYCYKSTSLAEQIKRLIETLAIFIQKLNSFEMKIKQGAKNE